MDMDSYISRSPPPSLSIESEQGVSDLSTSSFLESSDGVVLSAVGNRPGSVSSFAVLGYSGNLSLDGKRHGFGVYRYTNGDVYEGGKIPSIKF